MPSVEEAAVAELWESWGALAYLVAAVWAFFEGETFVIIAAGLEQIDDEAEREEQAARDQEAQP